MRRAKFGREVPVLAIALALLCATAGIGSAGIARADDPAEISGASLQARYVQLREQLASNQFRRPLYLESSESQSEVAGDLYALIGSPFESAATSLGVAGDWCDILILHINNKGCRVTAANQGTTLSLWIGSHHQQALADASQVDFSYRVAAASEKYLRIALSAGAGPMDTRDYRMTLEAIPVEGGKTFIHLRYSYGYGNFGRLAMQTYFATLARNKVGFTVVGVQPDGERRYIGGMRGLVERNAMRYYAAIEAFLGAQSASPQVRFEKRIQDWFAMIELYPRQLHEVEQGEYLEMKRMENLRKQAGPA